MRLLIIKSVGREEILRGLAQGLYLEPLDFAIQKMLKEQEWYWEKSRDAFKSIAVDENYNYPDIKVPMNWGNDE